MGSSVLASVEGVLGLGSKDTSYKFALLRAICDYVIERPLAAEKEHSIPLTWIATKWLDYYWPILVGSQPIPQGPKRKARRSTVLETFIKKFQRDVLARNLSFGRFNRVAAGEPFGWFYLREYLEQGGPLDRVTRWLILKFRWTILDQPIRHVSKVGGNHPIFFGLRFLNERNYEQAQAMAIVRKADEPLLTCSTLDQMNERDPVAVVVDKETFDSFRPMRFWIREAILSKWALFCEKMADARGDKVSNCLLRLGSTEEERKTAVQDYYREIFQQLGMNQCCWCGSPLAKNWEVDHVLPWSRFKVNAFWNLVPCCAKCNRGPGGKHSRIVEWCPAVDRRIGLHIEECVKSRNPFVLRDIRRIQPDTSTKSTEVNSVIEYVRCLHRELSNVAVLSHWRPSICDETTKMVRNLETEKLLGKSASLITPNGRQDR